MIVRAHRIDPKDGTFIELRPGAPVIELAEPRDRDTGVAVAV